MKIVSLELLLWTGLHKMPRVNVTSATNNCIVYFKYVFQVVWESGLTLLLWKALQEHAWNWFVESSTQLCICKYVNLDSFESNDGNVLEVQR